MTRRHLAAAIACLALLATGCDDSGDQDGGITPSEADSLLDDMTQEPTTPAATRTPTPVPTATPTPTPSPSATQAAEWVAPDPITADYVTRVLNELYRLEVPIEQAIVDRAAAGEPVGDAASLTDEFMVTRSESDASAVAGIRISMGAQMLVDQSIQPVGPVVAQSVSVLDSNDTCIIATVVEDLSQAVVEPDTLTSDVAMVPGGRKPNMTGWMIDAQGEGFSTQCSE